MIAISLKSSQLTKQVGIFTYLHFSDVETEALERLGYSFKVIELAESKPKSESRAK